MKPIDRRTFIKNTSAVSSGMVLGLPLVGKSFAMNSPNDTINVAVIGIRSRGMDHCEALAKIPNVKIAALCDIDSRLFPERVAQIEKWTGSKPETETEYRKILENKNIDAVSIATPNHWHALQTIWACQARKDVYVEKPVSHTILEGRKMIEAARKYKRIVQSGTQSRSSKAINEAINFLHNDGLGKVFMTKGLCLKPRAGIGHTSDSTIPDGVNWDAFLGPAPYKPFNENRYHYKWHWFWDTGNGDLGNQGPHQADIARWALKKQIHPVRIFGTGNNFVWDSDQETPNTQHIEFEYEDGSLLQFEVRGLSSNPEAGTRIGNIYYGSKGWMNTNQSDNFTSAVHYTDIKLKPAGYSSYKETDGPVFTDKQPVTDEKQKSNIADVDYLHFKNFIDCVRSRNWQDLNADISEGHLSSSLSHLGNIASRLKRTLQFDPVNEKFINDVEADSYLTKEYRAPYTLPEKV